MFFFLFPLLSLTLALDTDTDHHIFELRQHLHTSETASSVQGELHLHLPSGEQLHKDGTTTFSFLEVSETTKEDKAPTQSASRMHCQCSLVPKQQDVNIDKAGEILQTN